MQTASTVSQLKPVPHHKTAHARQCRAKRIPAYPAILMSSPQAVSCGCHCYSYFCMADYVGFAMCQHSCAHLQYHIHLNTASLADSAVCAAGLLGGQHTLSMVEAQKGYTYSACLAEKRAAIDQKTNCCRFFWCHVTASTECQQTRSVLTVRQRRIPTFPLMQPKATV